jgi:hypothetical protein
MFSELEKVMDYSIESSNFNEALSINVTGKKSNSGVEKTANYLKLLYGFDAKNPHFAAFKYFWQTSEHAEKPLFAFVYACKQDDLLSENLSVISETRIGEKVLIERLEENIEKLHPNQYSPNTRRSVAQNIASSFKQAGFVEGKVKNLRVQREITYPVACFAFLMAYLDGDRGDFIWNNRSVTTLMLSEFRLRELALECTKRDLMQYQFGGGVTAISFNNLLNKIGIDAI